MEVWQRLIKSRPLLWGTLLMLVLVLLGVLAFLARNYENNQAQWKLERVAAQMAADIKTGLHRHVQDLQSLNSINAQDRSQLWMEAFVLQHPELFALEVRDLGYQILKRVSSPLTQPDTESLPRAQAFNQVQQACSNAIRFAEAGYAPSYFWPLRLGIGHELMEMCLPVSLPSGQRGYLVATFRLSGLLSRLVRPSLSDGRVLALSESDGTRLSMLGHFQSPFKALSTDLLLDLPGAAYVLKVDQPRAKADWFPNLLTAAVILLSLCLLSVVYLLARDVRRRQHTESRLAASLAFRQAMEDSMVTGLHVRDLDGRTSYVNPAFCQLVGYDADVLMGKELPDPYWPLERANESTLHTQQRTLHQGNPALGVETELLNSRGERIPVRIYEAPLLDAQGQQSGWMSTLLDIREQRRMEEVNRHSQDRLQATARLAMVGEMASLISHELNQPLAAIASYATGSLNLLNAPGALDDRTLEDIRGTMQRMADEAARAGKVIQGVAGLVRRRDSVREAVSVQALFDAVAPLLQLRCRKEDITLHWRPQADCPLVRCDRTMVEQVLLNLARNGIQAMASGEPGSADRSRVLTLWARASHNRLGRWVRFGVVDQGHGLSQAVSQQLFTPFFTTKVEGMGLGLSLCRTVIEQHGGRLHHAPAQPSGTVFSFTLPVAP